MKVNTTEESGCDYPHCTIIPHGEYGQNLLVNWSKSYPNKQHSALNISLMTLDDHFMNLKTCKRLRGRVTSSLSSSVRTQLSNGRGGEGVQHIYLSLLQLSKIAQTRTKATFSVFQGARLPIWSWVLFDFLLLCYKGISSEQCQQTAFLSHQVGFSEILLRTFMLTFKTTYSSIAIHSLDLKSVLKIIYPI